MKDPHGQPTSKAFNRRYRAGRDIDELLGICRGLAADGRVNVDEARFLERWLSLNRETASQWPANVLLGRLDRVLQDSVLDLKEEHELLDLLIRVTGGDASKLTEASLSTGLPFDVPIPEIKLTGSQVCFTGKLLFGARDACHQEVLKRGGIPAETITKDLGYLVIGIVGSRDWLHSSYGTKIKKAVDYRESGLPLSIISEKCFVEAISVS